MILKSFKSKRRWGLRGLLLILGCGCVGTILAVVFAVVQAKGIPKAIETCLEPYPERTLLSQLQARQPRPFSWLEPPPASEEPFDLLITVSAVMNVQLKMAIARTVTTPYRPMSPQHIAHQLAVDRLRVSGPAQRGQTSLSSRGLNHFAAAGKDKLYMPQESYQALVAEGFTIPANIVATDEPPHDH